MKCARRPAGAHRPAPPPSEGTPAPQRPEPRRGRSRARLSLLLPVLALLLCALGLFAPTPAGAQSVAGPTNLAAAPGDGKLTVTWTNSPAAAAAPSDYWPYIRWREKNGVAWLNSTGASQTSENGESVGGGNLVSSYEITGLTNGTAYVVEIRYVRLSTVRASSWVSATARAGLPEVTLSAVPATVMEGSSVTVQARLSAPLSSSVSVPVTVTRNTSESGDHGTLSAITVNAGATTGTATIATNQDADAEDETFTVALGGNLPSSVTAGSATSVQIVIADDEGAPGVSLQASPNPVDEGSTVTVTATLTKALSQPVTIPLSLRRGTAEPRDFGYGRWNPARPLPDPVPPITIPANATSGTVTVTTNQDTDADDETFTVALGALPSSMRAVSGSSSVEVTIADDDKPAISLSAEWTRVPEGRVVKMTMTFSKPVPLLLNRNGPGVRTVFIPVLVTGGSLESEAGTRRLSIPVSGGVTSTSFFVATSVDTDATDETFTVALDTANLPGWARAGDPARLGLLIEDAAEVEVSLSASSRRVAEGSSITVTATLDKALSGNHELHVPVEIVTVDIVPVGHSGCLKYKGCDRLSAEDGDVYTRLNYIVIPAGSRTGTIEVHARQDGDTDDETFEVRLGEQRRQVGIGGSGLGSLLTIVDDDETPLELSVGDAALHEPEGRSHHPMMFFSVTLNRAVSHRVYVEYRTYDVTATAGADYVGVEHPLTLIFEPGETRKKVRVRVIDDGHEDSGETFKVVLLRAWGGARLGDAEGIGTIYNQEPGSSNANLYQLQVGGLSGAGVSAGGARTGLDIGAFSASTTSYAVTVPYGTTHVQLKAVPQDYAKATVKAGPAGRLSAARSGFWGERLALAVGANELAVEVRAENGKVKTYTVTVTREPAQAQQQRRLEPLTAAFENVPAGHDGDAAFVIGLRFSEALGNGAVAPVAASFRVQGGGVEAVEHVSVGLWRVRVAPKNWKDVTVTLAGGRACGEAGAVCASGGRMLESTLTASVGGPARIRIEGARAREGKDESLEFAVTLSRAVSHPVSVDYATADGTAKAGADYTSASGTLVFAVGETAKTVSVAVLDDAIDEGKETMRLRLSNPSGAYLRNIHRQATGVIVNDDALQQAWLSRFGRTVASDAVAAVTARLETPRDAGSHLTMLGQRVNLSQDPGSQSGTDGDAGAKALAGVLTGFAQAFGAPSAPPANDDDPFARHGLSSGWNETAPTVAGARRVTARELLLGTSFRAVLSSGPGMQLTSWGQGASVSQFSSGAQGLGLTGESATGSMGFDYERGRLLAGFAMTHSVGEGSANDAGWRYRLGSDVTTVLPYARLKITDRISAWGMAGTGTGSLSLDLDGAVAQRYRTDLSLTLTAMGVRGDLVKPAEAGGFALALKADAFWVRTESDRVASSEFGNLAAARGESSRVRAVLDGSRTFALAGGATLAPKVELGVRHDGGDAETGTGLEFGAGLGYADPSRGLDMALKVHGLAVHAGEGYEEWGVSGQLRLAPGDAGRGLSASLTPSYGADPGGSLGGSGRLWMQPDAAALTRNGAKPVPSGRMDAELGYGLALFGGRFTGTPNVGFGLSDAAREYRIGWRLDSAVAGDPGFEVNLDAMRREAANGDEPAEHGVMLRSLVRW